LEILLNSPPQRVIGNAATGVLAGDGYLLHVQEEANMVRIWFVEDEAADVELVRHELSRGGLNFDLSQITSESAFREGLEGAPPDLILSDRGLPGFDGFAALAAARARDPGLPFIFVTGSQGEEVAIRAFEGGATDFVLKHRLGSLTPAVRHALAQAEERVRHRGTKEKKCFPTCWPTRSSSPAPGRWRGSKWVRSWARASR
jgi:DNA-binding NtrC family response regulator